MNKDLKKSLKSFGWRLGAYTVVAVITYTVANLADLGVNAQLVTVIGLVAGEITKVINKKFLLEQRLGAMLSR